MLIMKFLPFDVMEVLHLTLFCNVKLVISPYQYEQRITITDLFKICGKLVNSAYDILIYIELSILASDPEIVVYLILQ